MYSSRSVCKSYTPATLASFITLAIMKHFRVDRCVVRSILRKTWNVCSESDIHLLRRRPEDINVNKTLLRLVSSVISKSLSVSRVSSWQLYSEHTKAQDRRGVGFLLAFLLCVFLLSCHLNQRRYQKARSSDIEKKGVFLSVFYGWSVLKVWAKMKG